MPRMRDHDVNDYAALRDMDATDVGVLTAADQACLDELGRYMVSTEAWKRFAIWLLHKHFEPHDGEVFRRAQHSLAAADPHHPDPARRILGKRIARYRAAVRHRRRLGCWPDRHGVR